jgi:hypothetical protein
MEGESEKTLKIIEFWKKAYDATNKNKNDNSFSIYDIGSIDFKNDNDKNNQLPFEPNAVLSKAPPTNQPRKRFSIYNLSSLDFTT